MARIHLALAEERLHRANDLDLAAWGRMVRPRLAEAEALAPGLAAALEADLAALEAGWPTTLPRGIIHADLFPDNVLFLDGAVSGVIDFYFACSETLAYDLAVALNAWAFDAGGGLFRRERARALIRGYESVRPLDPAERAALPLLARGAAMRFFATRLSDWTGTPAHALVVRKDPADYAARLAFWRDHPRLP